jgi:predicted alpha/beta-fold hydrolase
MHVVCIGPRGQQGIGKFTSPMIRCAGRDSDVREVVDFIHHNYCSGINEGRKLLAIGYSLGANKLARMMGKDGDACKIAAAYICQPPMRYGECMDNIKNSYGGLMDILQGIKMANIYRPHMEFF